MGRREELLEDQSQRHLGPVMAPRPQLLQAPQPRHQPRHLLQHLLQHLQVPPILRPQSWPQQMVAIGRRSTKTISKLIRVFSWELTKDSSFLVIQPELGVFVYERLLRLRLAGFVFASSPSFLSSFGCTPLVWKLGMISFSKRGSMVKQISQQ